MYPETTAIIRDTIKRRYELIPYVYSLALESHMTATPPQRWTGWGYESDPEVWSNRILTNGETQYWLGDSLLIGSVGAPGLSSSLVYLPQGEDFINLNAPHQYLQGGRWVEIESKLDTSIPILARIGGAIPVGRPFQVLSAGEKDNPAELPPDDYRAIEIFPPKGASNGRSFKNTWYEDDGISPSADGVSAFTITYECSDREVKLKYEESLRGGFVPPWDSLGIILPVGDDRPVTLNGRKMEFVETDRRGRRRFTRASIRKRSSNSKL
jgi:alpha-glucosidase (family GH31 glycosyl hydrolase)